MLKRTLVLTTESARHPFRQTLPPHVFATAPTATAEKNMKLGSVAADDSDWKLFMLSFCAFFTAFYSFIF
ncbi:MAG: hypothetical protein ABW039_07565 [Sphingobium sp.]